MGLPVGLFLSKNSDPVVTGRISFISPNVSPTSQSILAKAEFPNPRNRLRNDQFVVARLIWSARPGILIPTAAIARLGGATFVFVAERAPQKASPSGEPQPTPGQPQLIARQKPVKLGNLQGNNYQVLEGISAGDQIVVSGILNVSDGTPITTESKAPPAATP